MCGNLSLVVPLEFYLGRAGHFETVSQMAVQPQNEELYVPPVTPSALTSQVPPIHNCPCIRLNAIPPRGHESGWDMVGV